MKVKVLRSVLTILFFLGLFMIFGAAGYGDWADEAGVYVSLGFIAIRFVFGVLLMLPLSVFFALGGPLDDND